MNSKIEAFSIIEAEKIAKYIVNYAVEESILEDDSLEELYTTYKNEKNEINLIDFKSYKVNGVLNKITERVLELFQELENGKSSILDLEQNLIQNEKILNYKKGIILEVPTTIISNNVLFQNLGPKIPIRLSLTGEIESAVTTSVTEYGINNAMITTNVDISVSEQILMPFTTKKITIHNKIPISISIVNGKVPSYYGGILNSTSTLLQIPALKDV